MSFELRFDSLLGNGRGFSFPCDECGAVDLNAMPERLRMNYFFARAEVGHDLTRPFVREVLTEPKA